mgnify:CR=1 FL=1
MKIVTKTLALSVFMLPALAFAEAVGGMGETLISIILILGGVYFILLPYVMTRLVYWILVICLASGKKTEKLNSGWILLDIFMFSLAGYWYISFVLLPQRESRERERLKELSQITLPAPQIVAGIAMPAGTYLETEIAERTHSEPDKFTYAKFPRPVVWNGIPITSIRRLLSNNDNYWDDYKIETNPEKPARIGQWLCAGKDLEWRLIPQANGKPPEIPYNQSAEPYVYLSRCDLEEGQFASLPEFGAMLEVSSISRENDKYRDAAKGFWRTGASGYGEESRESSRMDFYSLELSVDTARMVHEFAAKLEDNNPDMNCQIPEHTFLVWQKSRPNVILAASPEPKRIPKKCWGKTLVPTPIEALSKQLGPNYESFFNGAEQYFKQTQAVSSKQKNFEKP